jgi:DNA-binding NtrC family response regulator
MMMLSENVPSAKHDPLPPLQKKTVLVYSADLNFCFSLSMVLQNKYNVITTTNCTLMEKFAADYSAQLAIVDAPPSEHLIECLHAVRKQNDHLPIILLYVYSPKDAELDNAIRREVTSVFYKPFDLTAMSKRISELLPA